MAFDPIFYDSEACMSAEFATTPADGAIAKWQLVKFGANNDTVTAVTAAGDDHAIGVALEALTAGENVAGRRISVRMLGSFVVPMKVGAAVTLGTKVVCQGTTGRIADVGAAANTDARTIVGIALGASAVAGDLVPVLVK